MKRPIGLRRAPLAALIATAFGAVAAPASAQLSLGAGLEFETGRYGKAESTVETSIPLRAAWSAGRWRLQADLPLATRVEGLASALAREEIEEEEAGAPVPAPRLRTQSGAGDLTLSAWYSLPRPAAARTEAALGARLKTQVAAAERCLLTNGATDLSLEARLRRPLGAVEAAVTVGWTRRGDPVRRDAECRPIGGRTDSRATRCTCRSAPSCRCGAVWRSPPSTSTGSACAPAPTRRARRSLASCRAAARAKSRPTC